LAATVLGFVIFQGLLGGMRVLFVNLDLAIVHGITAQVFFCVATLAAIVTSSWWNTAPNLAWSEDYATGKKLMRVSIVAVFCVFLQLVIGAVMRHEQAGLAIPDLPLAYGHLLPPASAAALAAANAHRAFDLNLDPVTLGQIWLHFAHRLGAIGVSVATIWLAVRLFLRHRSQRILVLSAAALCLLLLAQITLGVLTVIYRKPADIASAHVAVGALILVTCFSIAVRSMRLYSRQFRTQSLPVAVQVRSIGTQEFLTN
jgi:cytochrome c oxidase assembly protein subunit 15